MSTPLGRLNAFCWIIKSNIFLRILQMNNNEPNAADQMMISEENWKKKEMSN